MRLVLVRHGQSTWNLEGRLQGQRLDVPLTPLGLAQAEAAAGVVTGLVEPATIVVSSDQLRAEQTAEVVAARLGGGTAGGLVTTPLLREQHLGELEGRLTRDLVAQPTPAGVDVSEVAWGGGESLQQVHSRMVRLLDWVEATFAGHDELVLVGHGDSLRVLLAVLDGRGHREVEWTRIDNGQVLVREHTPGSRRADGQPDGGPGRGAGGHPATDGH